MLQLRVLVAMLLTVLALGLAACGGDDEDEGGGAGGGEPEEPAPGEVAGQRPSEVRMS